MGDKPPSLQDKFLNECRRSKTSVTIFLMKGIKLNGVITWFDAFSLLLRRDGVAQLVYKHSISTIVPTVSPAIGTAPDAGGDPKRASLQELFLAATERDGQPVTLYLVNGVMLQGEVGGHDQFALVLSRESQLQLVYKHAISTIQPSAPLALQPGEEQ